MPAEYRAIKLPLPLRLGSVNCYLLKTGDGGYVLIDTGCSNGRRQIDGVLQDEGCRPGNLRLIVITHGDFDHAGNAAYLRGRYGAGIAMHWQDAVMVERGDMFLNRTTGNALTRKLIGLVAPVIFGFGKAERFMPDVYLDDGCELAGYGLDARVVHTPGHSRGSISVLTGSGGLFCGDLLVNADRTDKPGLNSIVDDKMAMEESVARLKTMGVNTVHPGHGRPFAWTRFMPI